MGSLFDFITEWLKQGLIEAITVKFSSIFDSVNRQVGEVASQVGQTPQAKPDIDQYNLKASIHFRKGDERSPDLFCLFAATDGESGLSKEVKIFVPVPEQLATLNQ